LSICLKPIHFVSVYSHVPQSLSIAIKKKLYSQFNDIVTGIGHILFKFDGIVFSECLWIQNGKIWLAIL